MFIVILPCYKQRFLQGGARLFTAVPQRQIVVGCPACHCQWPLWDFNSWTSVPKLYVLTTGLRLLPSSDISIWVLSASYLCLMKTLWTRCCTLSLTIRKLAKKLRLWVVRHLSCDHWNLFQKSQSDSGPTLYVLKGITVLTFWLKFDENTATQLHSSETYHRICLPKIIRNSFISFCIDLQPGKTWSWSTILATKLGAAQWCLHQYTSWLKLHTNICLINMSITF